MRPAVLVVRLPAVALALGRVVLVVALTMLAMLRTIITVVLLAVTATAVVIVIRHGVPKDFRAGGKEESGSNEGCKRSLGPKVRCL